MIRVLNVVEYVEELVMGNKNRIAVKILGQDHYLISTDDPNYVEKVAKLVDDRMQVIYKSNSTLSKTKIAILTALNLADDLTKTRSKVEELNLVTKPPKIEIKETKNQITSLTKHVSEAESLYDNILNELDMIKSSRKNQESQLRSLSDRLEIMCGDMADGDEALKRATNRIAELEEKLLLREGEIAEYIRVFDELETEKLQELEEHFDTYEEEIIYEDDIEE